MIRRPRSRDDRDPDEVGVLCPKISPANGSIHFSERPVPPTLLQSIDSVWTDTTSPSGREPLRYEVVDDREQTEQQYGRMA
jgi:hypothetical protein